MKIIKSSVVLITLFIGMVMISNIARACDFEFKVTSGEKDKYSLGDEIVVQVTMHLTHRICPETLESTKFEFSGLKVLGATKWQETETGVFQRRFKLEVFADDNGKYIMNAKRMCSKEGGNGSIRFALSSVS
jgi:hypothetical protein